MIRVGTNILTIGGRTLKAGGYTPGASPSDQPSVAPTAAYGFSGNSLTIDFTDQSTLNGGPPIVSWEWDFGDGTQHNQQNPQHTFPAPGNYAVSLRVIDAAGLDSTFREQRTVGPFEVR